MISSASSAHGVNALARSLGHARGWAATQVFCWPIASTVRPARISAPHAAERNARARFAWLRHARQSICLVALRLRGAASGRMRSWEAESAVEAFVRHEECVHKLCFSADRARRALHAALPHRHRTLRGRLTKDLEFPLRMGCSYGVCPQMIHSNYVVGHSAKIERMRRRALPRTSRTCKR